MYPIKLNPIFKEIVWGGERLKSDYGYESDLNNIAEAWVLTARNDGDNTVKNGEYAGQSFTEIIKNNPSFLGKKGEKYNEFPLLIKFIDAKSDLSIQVHPDDDYARIHENSLGKTEAWYILDCSEDAELIYGFNKEITKDEFENLAKAFYIEKRPTEVQFRRTLKKRRIAEGVDSIEEKREKKVQEDFGADLE